MVIRPDLIATIRFFETEEGGRKGPTPPTLFRCPFEFGGGKFDCALDLTDVGSVAPGQTIRVPLMFLSPDLIKARLRVGDEFKLWELRSIAEGVVEEIVMNAAGDTGSA